ncbi:MAG: response regulator transcription factor [Bacteroidota bacterium]
MGDPKILILDPDKELLKRLRKVLADQKYQVFTADHEAAALDIAFRELPHMVVTELVLQETDGINLCMELRDNPLMDRTVMVILSERSDNYSQIAAYNAGIDDYLLKPVHQRLFCSKVQALLRRYNSLPRGRAGIKGLDIDRERFVIRKENQEIYLPRKEFELLSLLASRPQKVFTRDEIKTELWNIPADVRNRTIDVHIRKLREKVGEHFIQTVKGVGYKIEA